MVQVIVILISASQPTAVNVKDLEKTNQSEKVELEEFVPSSIEKDGCRIYCNARAQGSTTTGLLDYYIVVLDCYYYHYYYYYYYYY